MFKYSKLTIKIFMCFVFIISIYIIISVLLADPLQVFHKSFFSNESKYRPARESARAIIRDHEFDSIIVGSSLSENYSAKEVSNKLGGKFMNLSVAGAPVKENSIFINYCLKHKKIKKVLYVISTLDQRLREQPAGTKIENYNFIYDDSIIQNARIYATSKYLLCSVSFSQSKSCIGKKRNMDRPYAWDGLDEHMSRFGGFENWIKNKDNNQIGNCFKSLKKYNKNVDLKLEDDYEKKIAEHWKKYVIGFAKENPDVQFDIIIAPVSILHLSKLKKVDDVKYGHLEHFVASQKALVRLAQDCPNVTIYGFQDEYDMNEINNYKDFIHYHPDINYYMLDKVAHKQKILTTKNMDSYFDKVRKFADSYNYDYYRDAVLKIGE